MKAAEPDAAPLVTPVPARQRIELLDVLRGLATCELMAVCLYAVQVVVSRLWLTRFNYGPVEWIWRQLTYWKWVPIRNAPY